MAVVDETNRSFGKIDVLVANAVVNPYFGPSLECPDDVFDEIMGGGVQLRATRQLALLTTSGIGGLL